MTAQQQHTQVPESPKNGDRFQCDLCQYAAEFVDGYWVGKPYEQPALNTATEGEGR